MIESSIFQTNKKYHNLETLANSYKLIIHAQIESSLTYVIPSIFRKLAFTWSCSFTRIVSPVILMQEICYCIVTVIQYRDGGATYEVQGIDLQS